MTGKGGWEDRSDVSCPARLSAQELRELSSRRAYTLTRLALALVGCGGLLEWKQTATKLQYHKLPSSSPIAITLGSVQPNKIH